MVMEIDKQTFESFVPAFQTAGDEIFNRMQSFIKSAQNDLADLLGNEFQKYLVNGDMIDLAIEAVCTAAAKMAIPQLDLVLDETGFGVVSTNNIAPASRERVLALEERLRIQRSMALDNLINLLSRFSPWNKTEACFRIVSSLIWCPTDARRLGITLEGRQVYHEEFDQLRTAINRAEIMLTTVISIELYTRLVQDLYSPVSDLPENYRYFRSICKKYMAHVVMNDNALLFEKQLKDYLAKWGDEFPEYVESDLYKANHVETFKNEKDSKCVFW